MSTWNHVNACIMRRWRFHPVVQIGLQAAETRREETQSWQVWPFETVWPTGFTCGACLSGRLIVLALFTSFTSFCFQSFSRRFVPVDLFFGRQAKPAHKKWCTIHQSRTVINRIRINLFTASAYIVLQMDSNAVQSCADHVLPVYFYHLLYDVCIILHFQAHYLLTCAYLR